MKALTLVVLIVLSAVAGALRRRVLRRQQLRLPRRGGNPTFLAAVASALKPGARFVLETPMVIENLLAHLQDRAWKVGEIYLLVGNAYDHRTTRLDIEYTFVANGRVEVRRGSHRAYSYRELVSLIEAAGFSVELDRPWTRERRNLSFIATRR